MTLGKDVMLEQLRELYDVVLLAYGADVDTNLNIPGEDKANVISARELVAWYNGLPNVKLEPDLSGEDVVIFGQGNVAVDVARSVAERETTIKTLQLTPLSTSRILLSPIDELRKTDITERALEALSRSKIKRVHLVGRRGPLQAAFTIKELREMLKLQTCQTLWRDGDFQGVQEQVESLPRPRKRITELMIKSLSEQKANQGSDKQFLPVFFRSPLKINGSSFVESVDLAVTKLIDNKAIPTDEVESISAQMVCRSIGYRSINVDNGINFDEKRGVIKNVGGRVLKKESNEADPGLYTAGWLATGPSGVILTTMNNSFAVAQTIIHDIESGALKCESIRPGVTLDNHQVVSWRDWGKIDKREIESGKKSNKPREKILEVEEMLRAVSS